MNFQRACTAFLSLILLLLVGCASSPLSTTSADGNQNQIPPQQTGCYLLKVNFWEIEDMPTEIQQAIEKETYQNLVNTYGRFLRSSADSQSSSCITTRDRGVDDQTGINTGSLKRSSKKIAVAIKYHPNRAAIANTVGGIAKFYFTDSNSIEIRAIDLESKIVSPKLGYITFNANEWRKDPTGSVINGYVMSVHFFIRN
jgi:hypothetical protein